VIADLHGIWSAEYSEDPNGRKSERRLSKIKEIEKEVYERASDILVVSNNMKKYLLKHNEVKENKVTVVQNGADLHHKRARYKRQARLVFGGTFEYWEDLDTYTDMPKRDSTNEYYLIGSGLLQNQVASRIERENIRMNYLGHKNRGEALDLFSEMTIGVAPSTRNITRYVASPIKVYDYMACGLPVITADCGEWAKHIQESHCGFVTKNSSADEFIEAAHDLRDREVWEQKSKNAVEAIETKFNWNTVLAPIRDVLSRY
jgi:glycosyltransferase involved in cell wall biosynthesis